MILISEQHNTAKQSFLVLPSSLILIFFGTRVPPPPPAIHEVVIAAQPSNHFFITHIKKSNHFLCSVHHRPCIINQLEVRICLIIVRARMIRNSLNNEQAFGFATEFRNSLVLLLDMCLYIFLLLLDWSSIFLKIRRNHDRYGD